MWKLNRSSSWAALAGVVVSLCATLSVNAQDRPQVVAVNDPLAFFAERLLSDEADVVFPVPADVDPSFWRPSISDISTIQSADLILLNGAGFATWVDRVSLPRSKVVNTTAALKDRFIVTESITHSHGDGGEHSHEGLASYTWLDPQLALAQAEAVARAIVTRELAPARLVEQRLSDLAAELTALDVAALEAFASLEGVAMIATHPRYHYLERRYGLSITSLEWEAGAMPTAEQLAELGTLVADTGANILLWEAAPPQQALDAVAALNLRSVVFPPLAHRSDGGYLAAFQRAIAELAGNEG